MKCSLPAYNGLPLRAASCQRVETYKSEATRPNVPFLFNTESIQLLTGQELTTALLEKCTHDVARQESA
jgi:hypothetical protein